MHTTSLAKGLRHKTSRHTHQPTCIAAALAPSASHVLLPRMTPKLHTGRFGLRTPAQGWKAARREVRGANLSAHEHRLVPVILIHASPSQVGLVLPTSALDHIFARLSLVQACVGDG